MLVPLYVIKITQSVPTYVKKALFGVVITAVHLLINQVFQINSSPKINYMPGTASSINPVFAIESMTNPVMKVFTASSISLVEKEVNDWLQAQNVKLLHVAQSQSEKGGRFVFTISLFYIQR